MEARLANEATVEKLNSLLEDAHAVKFGCGLHDRIFHHSFEAPRGKEGAIAWDIERDPGIGVRRGSRALHFEAPAGDARKADLDVGVSDLCENPPAIRAVMGIGAHQELQVIGSAIAVRISLSGGLGQLRVAELSHLPVCEALESNGVR